MKLRAAIIDQVFKTAATAGWSIACVFAAYVGVDALRHGSYYGATLGLLMTASWLIRAWESA